MSSRSQNRKKGQYYLLKSIKELESLGYQVIKLEVNKLTFIKGIPIWIHSDSWASDLLAMNEKEIIFIQVKFETDGKFSHIKKWKEEFNKYVWPNTKKIRRELWLWEPRKKVKRVKC